MIRDLNGHHFSPGDVIERKFKNGSTRRWTVLNPSHTRGGKLRLRSEWTGATLETYWTPSSLPPNHSVVVYPPRQEIIL